MVKAYGFTAVIVPDAPSATLTPLYVTELFANCAFVIVPDNAVVGIVVDEVIALAPLA
jgi:hypothetical protein